MDFTIRPAVTAEFAPLCALLDQIDALHRTAHPDRFRAVNPARDDDFLQSWLDDPERHLWVAESASGLVGAVMFMVHHTPDVPIITPRTYLHVDTLVVDEHHQRQGIGHVLMDAVHRWGREHNITDIELGVYAFNAAAIAFYEHLGYQTIHCRMGRRLD